MCHLICGCLPTQLLFWDAVRPRGESWSRLKIFVDLKLPNVPSMWYVASRPEVDFRTVLEPLTGAPEPPKAERKPFEPLLVGRRLFYGPNRSECGLNTTIQALTLRTRQCAPAVRHK
jgi:hypothetical protein